MTPDMTFLRSLLPAVLVSCAFGLGGAAPGHAQTHDISDVITAEVRPGWRLKDGTHYAALHLRLAPGWKTYWRAPGDAGIPPLFDWGGSQNVDGVAVVWPVPYVFRQSGMRSVGYEHELVLPLKVRLRNGTAMARLAADIEIGLCKDVCIPHQMKVQVDLPVPGKVDGRIAAALADQPMSAAQAGLGPARCIVTPENGGLRLRTEVAMPRQRGLEAVIETADPHVWVSEPKTKWQGGTLIAESRLIHSNGAAFALDRSGVRITLLSRGQAIDIQGCTG